MRYFQFLGGCLLLMAVGWGCTQSDRSEMLAAPSAFLFEPQAETVLGAIDTCVKHYPPYAWDEIRLYRLADSSFQKILRNKDLSVHATLIGKLSPAHQADVLVSLYQYPRYAWDYGLACHLPKYAFAFCLGEEVVACVFVSLRCGNVRFRPTAGFRLGMKGMVRLVGVVEEMEGL